MVGRKSLEQVLEVLQGGQHAHAHALFEPVNHTLYNTAPLYSKWRQTSPFEMCFAPKQSQYCRFMIGHSLGRMDGAGWVGVLGRCKTRLESRSQDKRLQLLRRFLFMMAFPGVAGTRSPRSCTSRWTWQHWTVAKRSCKASALGPAFPGSGVVHRSKALIRF